MGCVTTERKRARPRIIGMHANPTVSLAVSSQRAVDQSRRPGPEHSLLVAIIRSAIFDALSDSEAMRDQRRYARWWFNTTEMSPFYFPWVAQHLNLSVAAVRRFINSQRYNKTAFEDLCRVTRMRSALRDMRV